MPWIAAVLSVLVLCTFGPDPISAQLNLSAEHERIAFLVGEWRTSSEFPEGQVGEGELKYRWVFDGRWMKVEFHGSHPQGAPWEAHVMQRWNPESEAYEAWVFRGDGPPLVYRGSSPEPGFFRVEHTSEAGVTIGIDYHEQPDGSVFQENWVMDEGERSVTLETTYEPVRD